MPKRKNTFNLEWFKEFGFIVQSSKDDFHALYTLFRCDVDINAIGQIQLNAATDKHSTLIVVITAIIFLPNSLISR